MTYNDCLHFVVCDRCPNCKPDECEFFQNKVDFVEVVHCKDCEYWKPFKADSYCRGDCSNEENGLFEFTKPNDFCSYGERTPQKEG